MKKQLLSLALMSILSGTISAQKILFDNTKAESAGNADWVIDADLHDLGFGNSGNIYVTSNGQSDAQRYPTPAQSGITSSTAETYWTGAISSWGIECVKTGYTVESLPYNVPITYGDNTNPQDLSNYDAYIVDEPNIVYTAAEKTAILNFVHHGGGLFMVSDHNISDRNNDGWDSPNIWNDLMSNNSVQANPFGFSFDLQNFSGSYYFTSVSGDPILAGPYGTVDEVKWSNGTSITLHPSATATTSAVIYKAGTTSGNNNILFAKGYYGSGKFVAMCDSSPTDDNSGDPNDQLYNGWITDASGNHRKLIMNATIWLVSRSTGIAETDIATISIAPNPVTNILTIRASEPCSIAISDVSGRAVMTELSAASTQTIDMSSLSTGVYMVKIIGAHINQTQKIIKQ